MSRSNNSDGRKLFNSDNDTRCPSSSSSSKSDDGDVLRNGAAKAILGSGRDEAALKGGSEAPSSSDVFYEYVRSESDERVGSLESSNWSRRLCRVSAADMKIVRLKKFTSDDSKILFILDVPQQQQQRKRASGDPKRSECAFASSMDDDEYDEYDGSGRKSRKRFEVSRGGVDRSAQKLQESTAGVSEWRRPQPPRNDAATTVSSTTDDDDDDDGGEFVDGVATKSTPMKRVTETSQFEPVRKKPKNVADDSKCVSKIKAGVACVSDGDPLNRRTCVLRRCSDVYGTTSTASLHDDCPPVYTWSKLKTSTRTTVVDKPNCKGAPKTFLASRKDVAASFRTLLGEDNIKAVSSNGGDTSTSDANDDELNSSNNDDSDSKAKKKNRCALCRKKVGLTGFECRCGGLYCGMHRYSDKHNCTFDYRQLGAQEIRRNNPVVIGEKIQKI